MAYYLVTGGAGFIGSHITEWLVNEGHRVRILDNLSTGKEENIAGFCKKIEFIKGDIRDKDTVCKAADGADYILHQAAIPSVPRSFKDPASTLLVNGEGTLQVLMAAKDAGVKRVVYASSSSVYGEGSSAFRSEDMPVMPMSPYAVSKLLGEQYCMLFNRLYGTETIALRYFNVFGPRQDPNSMYSAVVPRFISACMNKKPVTIYGDGEQSRDFTYVANVVRANILACTAPSVSCGKAFNIGCGGSTTVNRLAENIRNIFGIDTKPEYLPRRQGDIRHSSASISRAEKELGYRPETDIADGLKETVEKVLLQTTFSSNPFPCGEREGAGGHNPAEN